MAASTTGKYKIKKTSSGNWENPPAGVQILAVNGFDARGKAVNVYTAQWVNSQSEDFLITTIDGNNNPVVIRENIDITVVFAIGRRYIGKSGMNQCSNNVSTNVYLSEKIETLEQGVSLVTEQEVTFYKYVESTLTQLGSGHSFTNSSTTPVDVYVALSEVGYVDWHTTIDEQTQYDAFVDYMTDSDVWVASTYVGKQAHCMALDKVEPKMIKLKRGNNSYILGEITLHTLGKPSAYSG